MDPVLHHRPRPSAARSRARGAVTLTAVAAILSLGAAPALADDVPVDATSTTTSGDATSTPQDVTPDTPPAPSGGSSTPTTGGGDSTAPTTSVPGDTTPTTTDPGGSTAPTTGGSAPAPSDGGSTGSDQPTTGAGQPTTGGDQPTTGGQIGDPTDETGSTEVVWVTGQLPQMRVGEQVQFTLHADNAVHYSVMNGALPPGVTLSGDGTVSGVPVSTGEFGALVWAWNQDGHAWAKYFSGTVLPPAPLAAPSGFQVEAGSTGALVSWSGAEGTAWSYHLKPRMSDEWGPWTPTQVPSAHLAGLTAGTEYVVEVVAHDLMSDRDSEVRGVLFTTAPVAAPGDTTSPVTTPPAGVGTSAAVALRASVGDAVAGAKAEVDAAGLLPGSAWTIVLRSTPQQLASGTVAPDGALLESVTIPAGLEAGWHSLTLSGTAADGSAVSRVLWFEVTAAGTLSATSTVAPVSSPVTLPAAAPAAPGAAAPAAPAAARPAVRTPAQLATTGADTSGLLGLAALGLLGLGAGAVVVSRRAATR